jgi:hypothetical protein
MGRGLRRGTAERREPEKQRETESNREKRRVANGSDARERLFVGACIEISRPMPLPLQ